MHEVDQAREVVFREHDLELHVLLALVAARHLVQGAAAIDGVDHKVYDLPVVVGDDIHAYARVDACHEVVYHQAVDPRAHQAHDDQAHVVDQEGRAAYSPAPYRDRRAQAHVAILVDDLGQDVEPARRGVDAEQYRLRHAQHQHKAQQVEPRVGDHLPRALYRDSKERLLDGAHCPQKVDHGAQNEGRVHRLGPKLVADEHKCKQQQDGVDDKYHGAHRQEGHKLGNHERQAGDRAHDEVTGNEKEIYRARGNKHARGHDDQVEPELLGGNLRS